jgi:hypothetical protein
MGHFFVFENCKGIIGFCLGIRERRAGYTTCYGMDKLEMHSPGNIELRA